MERRLPPSRAHRQLVVVGDRTPFRAVGLQPTRFKAKSAQLLAAAQGTTSVLLNPWQGALTKVRLLSASTRSQLGRMAPQALDATELPLAVHAVYERAQVEDSRAEAMEGPDSSQPVLHEINESPRSPWHMCAQGIQHRIRAVETGRRGLVIREEVDRPAGCNVGIDQPIGQQCGAQTIERCAVGTDMLARVEMPKTGPAACAPNASQAGNRT